MSQKFFKKCTFGPSSTYWTPSSMKGLSNNFGPPNFMTACVRHLNTKFNADQTDPAQIISSGARQRFLQCHQVTSYFFVLVTDWKVSSCGKANNTKFDLDPKRGRYWISQRILSNSFQKTFHVPFSSSFFIWETRTHLSTCPRVPRQLSNIT